MICYGVQQLIGNIAKNKEKAVLLKVNKFVIIKRLMVSWESENAKIAIYNINGLHQKNSQNRTFYEIVKGSI